jgi:hypothetical protein
VAGEAAVGGEEEGSLGERAEKCVLHAGDFIVAGAIYSKPMRTLLLLCTAFVATSFAQTPAPSPSVKTTGKFYEMRIYHAFPGKLEDLHNRFRNHTNALFVKHGMEIVGFWGPMDKEKGSEKDLIYVLAYPSREARDASWKAFQADPEWVKARTASEANGKLVEKAESIYMGEVNYFTAGMKAKKK